MGDPGQTEWDPPSSLQAKYREKVKKLQSDRVNGKGSAASSSAVPRRGRCSGGACSRSCSPPKDSEVEQAGSPQAPIFGRRKTSATPRGATCVLDRGKSILIADEDHVGGGGGECSYQAPEADSLERPQNSRAVSQLHGHDKKRKKETNDAADRVATSSSTVPGNLFPTAGPVAAPAETPINGIQHRNGKFVVDIRVAKKKSLGFDRISLGSHCTCEQAYLARLVGDYYCRKWPPADCSISELPPLPFLRPLDPKLPPDEMMEEIKEIAWRTARTVPLRTHPGRGLINAAAAAPVQQRVENEEGCSHFELDHVQQLDQPERAAAAAGVNNPSSDLDQICSEYLGPDTTQQDDFPNTQELQHLPQQRSSHGTAAPGDSQTLEAADQLEAASVQEAAATNHVNIMDEDDRHSGGSWDVETALNLNADWLNHFFDQCPDLMWDETNSGNLQSDMELDQLDWETNLPILSDSTIPHNNVSTIAHDNIQESEENQGDKMFEQLSEQYWKEIEAGQFWGEQYCDEMQYQQMQF
ncbi:unnamed protein product [Sphagnum jensenii]|uniref:Uncharacterized protein n=1 Tax=Sphagnum jensenii TaxID=128206 RepID=A0ABP1BZQ9_9BRYO